MFQRVEMASAKALVIIPTFLSLSEMTELFLLLTLLRFLLPAVWDS